MTRLAETHVPAMMYPSEGPGGNGAAPHARLHVAVLEPDAALRSVLTRTLIRAGCVVVFQRTLEQAAATLATHDVDAAIIALDQDLSGAVMLERCKTGAIRLIILSYRAPDPALARRLSSVHFVQKPFDVRTLLSVLFAGEQIPEVG